LGVVLKLPEEKTRGSKNTKKGNVENISAIAQKGGDNFKKNKKSMGNSLQ